MTDADYRRALIATAVGFVLLVLWDLLGQDLAMAHWFGDARGFAWRDHWFVSGMLHQGARRVAWTLQLVLLLMVWWPVGVLRRLTRRERLHMFIAAMVTVALVSLLKDASTTSCPWDLAQFGGPEQARYLSHWRWGSDDGGRGNCFPAGHVTSAFCFFSGWFALRAKAPRAAAIWLAVTLLAGLVIGVAQQMRGAHYTSHTLWTAWFCWAIVLGCYAVLERSFVRGWFAGGAAKGA